MSDWYEIDSDLWGTVAGSCPPLFYFFDGYIDAGRVGATLIDALLERSDAQLVGTFDMDLVHDYRARRPVMAFDTDHWVDLREPKMALHIAKDLDDKPYLVLRGPEPDQRWRLVRHHLIEFLKQLNISIAITGYGVPMTIPHTRPTPLAVHSTDPTLRVPNPRWLGRLEIPASFSAYLEYEMGQQGLRAYGVAAHVPHYLAGSTYTRPAAAALHRYAEISGLKLRTDELDLAAEANFMSIEADTEGDETAKLLLEQLEQQYDEYAKPVDENLPTADELAAAVEDFLAQQRGDNPPPSFGD